MKHYKYLLISLLVLIITGCVETHQVYYINPDGSGKAEIEADMVINPEISGQETSDSLSKETAEKIHEKIREILHEGSGVEAWEQVTYKINDEGELSFSGTVYFPDITQFDLKEIPVIGVSTFTQKHFRWSMADEQHAGKEVPNDTLSRKETMEIVNQMQENYANSRDLLLTVFSMFKLQGTFHFPYRVKQAPVPEKTGPYTVKIAVDGEQILQGFDKLMNDKNELRKLVEKKGLRKFDFNDPRLLSAAYPDGAIWSVKFRKKLFSGKKTYFNYQETVQSIEPKIPQIKD